MAGMAARASIAKSAANSTNFFIFSYLRLWNLTNLHRHDRTPPLQAPSSKRMIQAVKRMIFEPPQKNQTIALGKVPGLEELAPRELEGGLPLFTENPRRLILGNPYSSTRILYGTGA